MVNRNDVSGQFLEIKSYKRTAQSTIYTYFKKKYFVTDFEKIDKDLYSGYLIIDGEKTELKVTIEYLRSGDMRLFHVTAWHSEEECDVDFLYDRVQGTLELDQLPGLRSSESYRRYRELTYGEVVYFGTLHEKLPDFSSAKKSIQTPPSPPQQKHLPENAIHISSLELSTRCYNALCRAKLFYVNELTELTADQWTRIRNLNKKGIFEIAEKASRFGFSIKNPFSEE